jgi:cytochrome c biogenesis protein CcmG, thiol:disulfide interchange protein DsbE
MKRLVIVIVLTAALAGLFAYGVFAPRYERDVASPRLDREMPDFRLETFPRYFADYGSTVSLSEFAGKPVVVNFWASWCRPACYNEAPHLEAAWRSYGDRVQFVGVGVQDPEPQAEAFLDLFNFTFPSGKDPNMRVSIDYGVHGLPETFFIRGDGTLKHRHIGEISEGELIRRVEALLDE